MKTLPDRSAFFRAFTLIELLVVIAIIGILAGLLFPAVNGAMEAARKASAKTDVVQIANAVILYESEYGRLPTNAGSNVSGTLLGALMGTNTNDNPRRIVFLEVANYKRNKGGMDSGGTYRDPWSNAYLIRMDTNYSNSITVGTNSEVIRKRVGIWNDPSGTATDKKRRYVTSWD